MHPMFTNWEVTEHQLAMSRIISLSDHFNALDDVFIPGS